jgi:hypothetical protein
LMTSEIFSNFLKKLSETWLEILKENKEKWEEHMYSFSN